MRYRIYYSGPLFADDGKARNVRETNDLYQAMTILHMLVDSGYEASRLEDTFSGRVCMYDEAAQTYVWHAKEEIK